jgi:hypothetical protein
MSSRDELLQALAPVLEVVRGVDPASPDAVDALSRALPLDGPVLKRVRALVREGVERGWLCERENAGVRFSRVQKSVDGALSIDAVHMSIPGMAHTHPAGEIDLCFAVDGAPKFDGRKEGWVVYPPMSWHVPTVEGGAMDILYFLPEGRIEFGAMPTGAHAVGLQAHR